jgi:hypothetical protein
LILSREWRTQTCAAVQEPITMTRRIALTLGMGVALMSLAARPARPLSATDAAAFGTQIVLTRAVSPGTPHRPHRSGYIVASS